MIFWKVTRKKTPSWKGSGPACDFLTRLFSFPDQYKAYLHPLQGNTRPRRPRTLHGMQQGTKKAGNGWQPRLVARTHAACCHMGARPTQQRCVCHAGSSRSVAGAVSALASSGSRQSRRRAHNLHLEASARASNMLRGQRGQREAARTT